MAARKKAGAVALDDIPAATRKKLGLEKPRTKRFTAEAERRHAIKVLAAIAELSQGERARVLRRAAALNSV